LKTGNKSSFFEDRQQVIDSDPPSGADKRLDERVDVLLGIAKYTNDEITHFTGYPENALIVSLAQSPEAPPKVIPVEPAPPSHIEDKITGSRLLVCQNNQCVEKQPVAPLR
jgi:hypothetical protein